MTPLAFYRASAIELKRAFHSVMGYHWWLRLHGYEDGGMYRSLRKIQKKIRKVLASRMSWALPVRPMIPDCGKS